MTTVGCETSFGTGSFRKWWSAIMALMLSGALAHMAGRNEDAVGLFGRALAINEQPDFHYNIGLAKWALGQRSAISIRRSSSPAESGSMMARPDSNRIFPFASTSENSS